ncbi:MAG: OmpA family protein [Blastocatellia bacterium]|nr:OmpA family protein [Blastocatellia bacterium]
MYLRTFEEPVQGPLRYGLGDAAASLRETERRSKHVAASVTEGLKLAKDSIPHLSKNGQQELLQLMISQLENFFPLGHGLVDSQGKVLRQSQKAIIGIPVGGAPWPFEHYVRLYLNDQTGFGKNGDHYLGNFSSIRLFTRALHKKTPRSAVRTALHEMTHMTFAMVRRFEQRFGGEIIARFLSGHPWRLLALSGFEADRKRLERHLNNLLRVLPIPMQAGELAASLIEEAFAFVIGTIVDEAIAKSVRAKSGKRGPAILPSEGFSPEAFLTYYVLEQGFAVTPQQLASPEAQAIYKQMKRDVDALAAAIRTHLDSERKREIGMYIRERKGLGNTQASAPRRAMPAPRSVLPSLRFDNLDRFAFNKASLTDRLRGMASHLATAVTLSWKSAQPITVIRLVGHTDGSGGETFNRGLGDRRAQAVKAELQGKLKGLLDRVLIMVEPSPGKSRLTADNRTGDGRDRNRRVEVFIETGVAPSLPPSPKETFNPWDWAKLPLPGESVIKTKPAPIIQSIPVRPGRPPLESRLDEALSSISSRWLRHKIRDAVLSGACALLEAAFTQAGGQLKEKDKEDFRERCLARAKAPI